MKYVIRAKGAIQLMSLNNAVLMPGEELEVEEVTDELKRAERWGSVSITEIEEITVTTELPKEVSTEVPVEIPKEPETPSEPEEESSEEEPAEEPEDE